MNAVVTNGFWLRLLATALVLLSVLNVQAGQPRRGEHGFASLRAAMEDLSATFGPQYPRGSEFLARLDQIEPRLKFSAAAERMDAQLQLAGLAREALIANPLVSGQPLVFVQRPQYRPDHHSTETMFVNGEINSASFEGGGALKVIEFGTVPATKGGPARVRTLLDLPRGIARDPDVSFDGRKILFSMRRDCDDDYHLYEIDADGRNLRQLTFGRMLADISPAYLPNGKIVFSSTRDLKYCQCARNICPNLFVLDPGGGRPVQIGRNNLPELHASVMPDGRILYDRWEYVDRHFGPSFGLWTMNPDGTNHALYYGNNSWSPGAIFAARIIPGTQQVVSIFGACHDRPWGAMAVIDRRLGSDGTRPVARIWPAEAMELLKGVDDFAFDRSNYWSGWLDRFARVFPKYEDPYPLADGRGRGAGKYFLVSRSVGQSSLVDGKRSADPARMAIFLVDLFGNELLLWDEPPGCFDPKPLAARDRPPVIPDRTDPEKKESYFYVHDVYRGSGMEAVPRGTVKYLRIVEAPPKRSWSDPGYGIDATQAPAMNWNLTNNKAVIGDVPVDADGSAYFSAPAGRFLYFQALDKKKMMVQSMRSGTTVMPGETAGCAGCHEDRRTSVPPTGKTAVARPPSRPAAWYGPPREFNYLSEVQPVLDRHCVGCHDFGKDAGKKLNLAGDLGMVFNTSYVELQAKSALRWHADKPGDAKLLVKAVHDGPPGVLPPYAWGSHRSRLVEFLRPEHYDVTLSEEETARIVTWIDLNTPYYGTYFSVYPGNRFGRSPLTDAQYVRLRQLTGTPDSPAIAFTAHHDLALVNFTRPERSPILEKFGGSRDAKYRDALAVIRAGQTQLARQPREDMLGANARPIVPEDLRRIERLNEGVPPNVNQR